MLKKISLLRDRVNDSTSGLGQAHRTGNNSTQAKTGLEWATRARPSPRAPGPPWSKSRENRGCNTFTVAIHYPVKPATGFWVAQRFIAAICALIEGAAPFRFERGATELNILWVLISKRS